MLLPVAVLATVILFVDLYPGVVAQHPSPNSSTLPTVRLDHGIFVGNRNGSVHNFLGIPFALPPTGDRRFRLPEPNLPYNGTYNATAFGDSCPQQSSQIIIPNDEAAQAFNDYALSAVGSVNNTESEDCLHVNVWAPANATAGLKLPVLVWIFGGSFEIGTAAGFNGGVVVQRSLDLGTPVIYVNMNYRLSLFGFLGGEEVKAAGVGNLGLQDRNHEGLFQGAIMQSGSPEPLGDITRNQHDYDTVVNETGCANADDTLQCLRGVSYESLQAAANKSTGFISMKSLNLVWGPRVDGVFLKDDPHVLIQKGDVANVPFITGNCDDEGTLPSLALTNISTDQETRDYMSSNYLPKASAEQIDQLLELYPADPAMGSPFGTGDNNTVTPQYKRIAALQGDLLLQGLRRFFLANLSDKQNAWSYSFKRGKSKPILGSYHTSDLNGIYDSVVGSELKDFIIRFAVNLDPNSGSTVHWPKYTPESPKLMTLLDGPVPLNITDDDYRKEAMEYGINLMLEFPM
ncbi:hypothetical protein EW146_g162 [Bondarzewia mesenterica]|uniref:Carboxylesterase type B domain-containing protein n=1 Tax=Bondarzewia mesenterica TaxID=1095465 RepID=A0A4S4MA52_9AGAM|nr:hypothetical protein EW146_g162 [Bondarzewia mesenterica]